MSDSARPADHDRDQFTRRHALWSALTSGLALSRFSGERQGKPVSGESFLPHQSSPETDAAIARGLKWLAAQQKSDGGFGAPRVYARNVGVCALSGLAFLPRGLPEFFQGQIRGCTDYLLAHAQPSGFIVEDHVVTHAPMYGHGFAVTYLSQVYGMDVREELKSVLKRAISLILAVQDKSGAWRYTPFPEDADVSVTTCQMLALCSARQAGFAVPAEAMDRSVEYLRRCQNPDGGFRYRLIDPPESLLPRSAAAIVALHAAGLHRDPAVFQGRQYLASSAASLEPSAPGSHNAEYYYYGRYYATHAAWQAGGETWARWFPIVREELLQRQTSAGHWHDPNIGNEYATAMALLTLQFSDDTLPLYSL